MSPLAAPAVVQASRADSVLAGAVRGCPRRDQLVAAADQDLTLRRVWIVAGRVDGRLCRPVVQGGRVAFLVVPDVVLPGEDMVVCTVPVFVTDDAIRPATGMHAHGLAGLQCAGECCCTFPSRVLSVVISPVPELDKEPD